MQTHLSRELFKQLLLSKKFVTIYQERHKNVPYSESEQPQKISASRTIYQIETKKKKKKIKNPTQ
jgi:hypothetical protein